MKIFRQLRTFIYFQKLATSKFKSYPFMLAGSILCNAVMPFTLVIFPRYILDEAFGERDINKLIIYISAMAITTIVLGILQAFFTNRLHFLSMKIKATLMMDMAYKTTKIKYVHLEDAEVLDMKQRASTFLQADVDNAVYATPDLISAVLATLGYVYIMSTLNVLIIVVMMAVILFNAWTQSRTEKYAYSYRADLAPIERKIAYFIMTIPNHRFGKDIRLFGMADWLHKKYAHQTQTTFTGYKKVFDKRTVNSIITTITSLVQTVCIYAWLVYQAFENRLTIGEFTMYFAAISNFSGNVTAILANWIRISNLKQGLDDFRAYMQLSEETDDGIHAMLGNPQEMNIEFRNVWFKYPNQSNYALKNINVKIPYGQKVSIVGENGAGKTSFIKLLTRLYEPTEGVIYFNGIDIREIGLQTYRKMLAVVFQDFTILSFTIKENVTLSDSEHESATDHAQSALVSAGLSDKLNTLPHGMNTYIETVFDSSGIQLSGGQAQKLAIARALYKESPILVLDEPTSALDPRAEYEIYRSFHEMSNQKTAFFVSHRLSSSRFCDVVFVFKNGEIVEMGSHTQLMNDKQFYAELYNMQAQFYEDRSNSDRIGDDA